MASAVAQAYNRSLGADPPARSRQSPWSGGAEALLIFGRSMEAANLHTFLKFGNANKSDICVIFAKNYEWLQNWRWGWSKNGACASPLGPSTPA